MLHVDSLTSGTATQLQAVDVTPAKAAEADAKHKPDDFQLLSRYLSGLNLPPLIKALSVTSQWTEHHHGNSSSEPMPTIKQH